MENLPKRGFEEEILRKIISNLPNWYGKENWDTDVLPFKETIFEKMFSFFISLQKRLFTDYQILGKTDFDRITHNITEYEPFFPDLSATYQLLQDDNSRSLLVDLITFRIMGFRKFRLPLNRDAYWNVRKTVSNLVKDDETFQINFRNWELKHVDLQGIGYPIELFILPVWITALFILKQYEYSSATKKITVEEGDYVIDAGGGWGDTSLYFSNAIGSTGKVFSFEFVPENLEVISRNLDMNPTLTSRIQVVKKALWEKSNLIMKFDLSGPASSINSQKGGSSGQMEVSTITIDDYVRENGIEKIDFIKMDIEGAELNALIGAENTLRQYKPKLAISVYHKQEDLWLIPNYLKNLNIGYELFLDHFTIYSGETILFAC